MNLIVHAGYKVNGPRGFSFRENPRKFPVGVSLHPPPTPCFLRLPLPMTNDSKLEKRGGLKNFKKKWRKHKTFIWQSSKRLKEIRHGRGATDMRIFRSA